MVGGSKARANQRDERWYCRFCNAKGETERIMKIMEDYKPMIMVSKVIPSD